MFRVNMTGKANRSFVISRRTRDVLRVYGNSSSRVGNSVRRRRRTTDAEVRHACTSCVPSVEAATEMELSAVDDDQKLTSETDRLL